MIKTEAEAQIAWKHYLQENPPQTTTVYELKICHTNSFNVPYWIKRQPHQLTALLDATNSRGVYHKISDQSRGIKPFDCFFAANAKAYLVIYWSMYQRFTTYEADKIEIDKAILYCSTK